MLNKELVSSLIVSGGDFSLPPDNIIENIIDKTKNNGGLIIACDSGYENAELLGIKPDILVGDFDSAKKPQTDIPIYEFPSRKDDTDTMLAIKLAIDRGCNEINICCALGGRMDHTFANIQAGAYAANLGIMANIYSANTIITVMKDTCLVFSGREGWSFSVFSLADKSEGVTIKGAKYEISDADVVNTFPWGQSNQSTSKTEVSVRNGMLAIIQSKLKPGEHI